MRILNTLFRFEPVYAHCDVPCGIYDVRPAMIAAETVLKMVQKIKDLQGKMDEAAANSFTRYVITKEEHARKCKEELFILWADFFKPEDIADVPDLHETFWKTVKLVSKNKQEVNLEAAQELVEAIKKISSLFERISEKRKKAA